MDDLTDTRHINRFEIVDTGRRRRWSAAEKLRIVEESFSGMIVAEQPEKGSGPGCGRIEIVSANGRRVIVDCDIDVETLLRIMRGLETLP